MARGAQSPHRSRASSGAITGPAEQVSARQHHSDSNVRFSMVPFGKEW